MADDIRDGLVFQWIPLLSHMGGTRIYDTVSGRVGTLRNMALPGTSTSGWGFSTRNRVYGEFRLDGTNDYIDSPDDPLFEQQSIFTFSFWMKLTTLASVKTTDETFFYKNHSVSPFYSYQIATRAIDDKLYIEWVNTTPTGFSFTSNTVFTINNWYYLVWVKDGANGKMYINGKDEGVGSPAYTGTTFNSDGLFYMGGVANSKNVSGAMDDIRIYSRALGVQEIQTLYNNGKILLEDITFIPEGFKSKEQRADPMLLVTF
jgi:hypothetical protein